MRSVWCAGILFLAIAGCSPKPSTTTANVPADVADISMKNVAGAQASDASASASTNAQELQWAGTAVAADNFALKVGKDFYAIAKRDGLRFEPHEWKAIPDTDILKTDIWDNENDGELVQIQSCTTDPANNLTTCDDHEIRAFLNGRERTIVAAESKNMDGFGSATAPKECDFKVLNGEVKAKCTEVTDPVQSVALERKILMSLRSQLAGEAAGA